MFTATTMISRRTTEIKTRLTIYLMTILMMMMFVTVTVIVIAILKTNQMSRRVR